MPGRLELAVQKALDDLKLAPVDGGAAELALKYARAADRSGANLEKLGPLLLAVLTALQMTPAARAAAVKGGDSGSEHRSPLDELRARRDRLYRASDLDATAN